MNIANDNFNLMHGDCLDLMKRIPCASVDLILCDLPYGTTRNKWDSVIPLDLLWAEYGRIIKPSRAIVLTAAQPFTSALVMSNLAMFKWEDIWHKSNATGHLNAKVMPLRQHENILVFCNGRVPYTPQLITKPKTSVRGPQRSVKSKGSYGDVAEGVFRDIPDEKGFPRSVMKFNTAYHERNAGLHPSQKPIGLFEYLLRTFSNEGDVVLDNCMGSGTTGVAAIQAGRRFIGMERDPGYFKIAAERIMAAMPTPANDNKPMEQQALAL